MTSKLLNIRDVAKYLNITEKEVIELAESGAIPAYKVGGVYLRFKKEQLDGIKHKIKPNQSLVSIEGTTFALRSCPLCYRDATVRCLRR